MQDLLLLAVMQVLCNQLAVLHLQQQQVLLLLAVLVLLL
jgi:hypothetical protein